MLAAMNLAMSLSTRDPQLTGNTIGFAYSRAINPHKSLNHWFFLVRILEGRNSLGTDSTAVQFSSKASRRATGQQNVDIQLVAWVIGRESPDDVTHVALGNLQFDFPALLLIPDPEERLPWLDITV